MRRFAGVIFTLALFVPLVPVHASPQHSYIPFDFGPDINGNVWNVWSSVGSISWGWSTSYVNGYLHYSLKIYDEPGLFCSGSCRAHVIWNKDPRSGFDNTDVYDVAAIFPESARNGHIYDVDIQWNSSGYTRSATDETSGQYFENTFTVPVTKNTYDAFTVLSNWQEGNYLEETDPSQHAAQFVQFDSWKAISGFSGGGADIRTTPMPVIEPASKGPSVLFIPGIEGSRLKNGNDLLWPPTILSNDLAELELRPDGTSVNPIIVDGVVDNFYGTPIYQGFTSFLDGLVAEGAIKTWESLAYDWRFSPEQIFKDGIKTIEETIDPVAEVEKLAAASGTGKVVIVAHSMGGLLGKVLIKKLEEKGEADLVESFVMVGTPQLGTPQAIGALLHGDDQAILGGLIVNREMARFTAHDFESAYDLLPSPLYFQQVTDEPINFDSKVAFTKSWRDYWGPSLNTYSEVLSFVTGQGVNRADPSPSQVRIPDILRSDLMQKAEAFHTIYDTHVFPTSIRVIQVAGWGRPTVKTIEYTTSHFLQSYKTLFTREGDGTVVYPSAVSSAGLEKYFFNIFDYNDAVSGKIQHRDLLNATSSQALIKDVINKRPIDDAGFIGTEKPEVGNLEEELVVSTHSPVILGVYDGAGHFSGINSAQSSVSGILITKEEIPGSTFISTGDDEYLFLPKSGTYHFAVKGTGTGPATIEISSFTNDTMNVLASYTNVPVTATTSITFTVDSSIPEDATLDVDQNGDGANDLSVSPDTSGPTLEQLLATLRISVQALSIKTQIKNNLIKKIDSIQVKINKQKERKSKLFDKLTIQVVKGGDKGKIDSVSVSDLSDLLEEIGSQIGVLPINPNLIAILRYRVDSLVVIPGLKTSLLKKIDQMQNMANVERALAGLHKTLLQKGTQGKIVDMDLQNLLELLTQAENAL